MGYGFIASSLLSHSTRTPAVFFQFFFGLQFLLLFCCSFFLVFIKNLNIEIFPYLPLLPPSSYNSKKKVRYSSNNNFHLLLCLTDLCTLMVPDSHIAFAFLSKEQKRHKADNFIV